MGPFFRGKLLLMLLVLLPRPAPAQGPTAQVLAARYLEGVLQTGTPATSAAVAVKGQIVFSGSAGFADLENMVRATVSTVFNIGSVSKVNTAVAIMQLVEQGRVRLDDPIQKYVPALPDKGAPITIWHLMTHQAGIRHYRTGEGERSTKRYSLVEAIALFKDDPLLFKPGEFYFYSSYGVNLLQAVVENASGLAFEDYLTRRVWGPAGMLSTALDVPERLVPNRAKAYRLPQGRLQNYPFTDLSYIYAGGGMISTAEDLVRLGVALNHGRLLKIETTALMYKVQLDPVMGFRPDRPPLKMEFRQGLLWRVFTDAAGRTFVNHCGSVKGFNACLVNYPTEDVVAAIMYNADDVSPGRTGAEELAKFFLSAESSRR
jgi:serine beta-lactamase-like protein LACTB, mitochondrial